MEPPGDFKGEPPRDCKGSPGEQLHTTATSVTATSIPLMEGRSRPPTTADVYMFVLLRNEDEMVRHAIRTKAMRDSRDHPPQEQSNHRILQGSHLQNVPTMKDTHADCHSPRHAQMPEYSLRQFHGLLFFIITSTYALEQRLSSENPRSLS